MKHSILFACFLCAFALTMTSVDGGEAKKKGFKPTETFAGKIADNDLLKLAPKAGFLKSQKELDELWTGWKLEGKTPKIDFAKQIVVVQLAKGGPNVPRSTYFLDKEGNLTVLAISTLIGGPGFGYSIDVLNRLGIKTYQGKKIE